MRLKWGAKRLADYVMENCGSPGLFTLLRTDEESDEEYHIVHEIYRYTGGGVVRIVRTSPTRIWAMDTPCHAKGENIATYTDVRGWKIWE